jgi:N-acetyl-1-D-myo-inositol-2-amino-2-deoxy-alpha-D-glucopyranoside deacetylase
MTSAERVLFVHAHPDDETIDTGGTIATLVDAGAQVCVLTCTRGERGEVIPDDLKPALGSPATMASLREKELAAAMKALGVTDHRYLGADNARWSQASRRKYVDSGMSWGKRGAQRGTDRDPDALTEAPFSEVAADIGSVIIAVGPDAVVSYDSNGGYGHPDHIRVHDASRHAAEIYGVPFFAIQPDGAPGAATLAVDIGGVVGRKRSALAAYRSQLTLDGDDIVLSGGQRRPVGTVERYALLESDSDAPIAFSDQHPLAQVAAATLAGVLGVCFGALLSVYNQSTASIAGEPIWVGAIAGILIAAALLAGLRLAFGTRIVSAVSALGMIVIVGILSSLGSGGSVIIPWNGPGILWQIAPTLIALVVLAWPSRGRRRQGRRSTPGNIRGRSTVIAPAEAAPKGPHQS